MVKNKRKKKEMRKRANENAMYLSGYRVSDVQHTVASQEPSFLLKTVSERNREA